MHATNWTWIGLALTLLLSSAARADEFGVVRRELLRPAEANPSLDLSNAQIDAALQTGDAPSWNSEDGFGDFAPRRWWALVASAALPGLGEVLTGHRRGYPMIAGDLTLWYFINDKDNEGNDFVDEYRAFAEEHWSEVEWRKAITNLPGSARSLDLVVDWFPEVTTGSSPDLLALYVSREEDEREWFENLGKWDIFAFGWDEYHNDVWNETHPVPLGDDFYNPAKDDPSTFFFADNGLMTPLRDQYVSIRVKSNDAFETRDNLLNVTVLLRVFSVLQVAYLEGFIGNRFANEIKTGSGPHASWIVKPTGQDGAIVGWRLSY